MNAIDTEEQMSLLEARAACAQLEHINQCAARDTAKYGDWQCDWNTAFAEVYSEFRCAIAAAANHLPNNAFLNQPSRRTFHGSDAVTKAMEIGPIRAKWLAEIRAAVRSVAWYDERLKMPKSGWCVEGYTLPDCARPTITEAIDAAMLVGAKVVGGEIVPNSTTDDLHG